MARTQAEKAERFSALHAGELFAIPNPWDAGAIEAMATAAEAMRDQGDLSSLVGSARIREWLGG